MDAVGDVVDHHDHDVLVGDAVRADNLNSNCENIFQTKFVNFLPDKHGKRRLDGDNFHSPRIRPPSRPKVFLLPELQEEVGNPQLLTKSQTKRKKSAASSWDDDAAGCFFSAQLSNKFLVSNLISNRIPTDVKIAKNIVLLKDCCSNAKPFGNPKTQKKTPPILFCLQLAILQRSNCAANRNSHK